jgi:mannose-6-phosphate isomerase-like protein (cupin superfamily)
MNDLLAVPAGEGEHFHFLNHLATVKVGAGESATGMNAVEFTAPRGFGPPLHVHHEEDELMYVVEGRIRLDVGDDSVQAETGTMVSLPHGIPHVFQVESDTARFITIASGRASAPSFDRFVAALGAPTDLATLPVPTEIDPGHVAQVCARHGIEVLGPPPAPLD